MAPQQTTNLVITYLARERERIAKAWIQTVLSASRGRMTPDEAERELTPLLDALIAAAQQGSLSLDAPDFAEVRAMLTEYSRTRARQGFTPSETAVAVFALRDAVLQVAREEKTPPYSFAEFATFSSFIDALGLQTFEAFVQTREAVITNQAEQLLELSTPVVKLWDGIVALPLVGTLDSERTQVVMEQLLQTLLSTGSAHAIIDITGVPAVDTQVAQHLLKTVFAARLMGADCVISGIRPQIAQTIVALGVEFGDIVTKSSLADALKITLQRAGLEVRKIEKRA
ncbi:MAG TPA: STAS domain-containing protein [Candidatus Sulfotelmatobacter sp.]|nr:STAS domain-containing protein [Candidatus Sulfotelmatobacter sp.]